MILLIVNLAQPRITCGDCLDQNSLWACLWGVVLAMLMMWKDPAQGGQHHSLSCGPECLRVDTTWVVCMHSAILSTTYRSGNLKLQNIPLRYTWTASMRAGTSVCLVHYPILILSG